MRRVRPRVSGKVDAIYRVDGDFLGRFAIVLEECIDCGFCVPLCPVDCIHDARTQGIVEGPAVTCASRNCKRGRAPAPSKAQMESNISTSAVKLFRRCSEP